MITKTPHILTLYLRPDQKLQRIGDHRLVGDGQEALGPTAQQLAHSAALAAGEDHRLEVVVRGDHHHLLLFFLSCCR